MPFFLRHLIILCFAFYCLMSHFLGQVQVLMGHQIQRSFISLPKDVLCSQYSKGRLLHVLDEASTDEGRNGLKVFGCIAVSRMPNHTVPFQTCVWLDFTLSRYWLNRLGFFSFLSRNPERQLLRQEKIPWMAIFPLAGRAICLLRAEGTMWTPSRMVSGGGGSSKCVTLAVQICFRKLSVMLILMTK